MTVKTKIKEISTQVLKTLNYFGRRFKTTRLWTNLYRKYHVSFNL